MTDLGDWIQSYWFELGSLLLQFATLVTLVWFGKNLLKIISATRTHVEAPEYAPPATHQVQVSEAPAIEAPAFRGVVRGLIPMDPTPSVAPAPVAYIRSEQPGIWRSVVKWLNTPMGNAPVAWRRMVVRRVS